MDKYGLEFFSFYIIEKCQKEDLNEREKYYISLYHSANPEFGYNETTGGDSSFNRPRQKLSEEHKRKISESNKGRKISKEQKNKISLFRKKYIEEHELNKKVYCLETDKIYNSILQAVKENGIKDDIEVSRCCSGKQNTAMGRHFCWLNEKENKEWDLRTNKEKAIELFGKKVFCRELNEQFESIRDVERILNSRGFNAKRSSISKCCHGKNKTHLNMHFSFI